MTLLFVQATNAHILSILPQPVQDGPSHVEISQSLFERGEVPLEGAAVSVLEDGECIGAYGWVGMWPGVYRVWALFSDELLDQYPFALARRLKRDLRSHELRDHPHRVEVVVDADHLAGLKLMEWLGFKVEGLMKAYTPEKQDFWILGKVQDGI